MGVTVKNGHRFSWHFFTGPIKICLSPVSLWSECFSSKIKEEAVRGKGSHSCPYMCPYFLMVEAFTQTFHTCTRRRLEVHVKRKGRRTIATFLLLNFALRCCSVRDTEPRPQKQDLTLLSKKWNSYKPFSNCPSTVGGLVRNGIRPYPLLLQQKVMYRSLRKQRDIGT